MRLGLTKIIGENQYNFSFDGADLWECIMESQKVSIYDIKECGLCHTSFLKLIAYETKEDKYKYVKVSCNKCKGSLTLGQAKSDNAYYYRRDKDTGNLDWQAFVEKEKTS